MYIQGSVTSSIDVDGYPDASTRRLDNFRILGVVSTISEVSINGNTHSDWSQDATSLEVIISNADITLNAEFIVEWN